MNIEFGSIEYFTLERLHQELKALSYNKLDLLTLDALRTEVEMKIKAINLRHNDKIRLSNLQK